MQCDLLAVARGEKPSSAVDTQQTGSRLTVCSMRLTLCCMRLTLCCTRVKTPSSAVGVQRRRITTHVLLPGGEKAVISSARTAERQSHLLSVAQGRKSCSQQRGRWRCSATCSLLCKGEKGIISSRRTVQIWWRCSATYSLLHEGEKAVVSTGHAAVMLCDLQTG